MLVIFFRTALMNIEIYIDIMYTYYDNFYVSKKKYIMYTFKIWKRLSQ